MTSQSEKARRHTQSGWQAVGVYAAALLLGAAIWYAVYTLSSDDCTTVTTTLAGGSRITTSTCS